MMQWRCVDVVQRSTFLAKRKSSQSCLVLPYTSNQCLFFTNQLGYDNKANLIRLSKHNLILVLSTSELEPTNVSRLIFHDNIRHKNKIHDILVTFSKHQSTLELFFKLTFCFDPNSPSLKEIRLTIQQTTQVTEKTFLFFSHTHQRTHNDRTSSDS